MSTDILLYLLYSITGLLLFVIFWHYKLKFSAEFRGHFYPPNITYLPVLGHGLFIHTEPQKLLPQLAESAELAKQAGQSSFVLWFTPIHPIIFGFCADGAKQLLVGGDFGKEYGFLRAQDKGWCMSTKIFSKFGCSIKILVFQKSPFFSFYLIELTITNHSSIPFSGTG